MKDLWWKMFEPSSIILLDVTVLPLNRVGDKNSPVPKVYLSNELVMKTLVSVFVCLQGEVA